MEIFILHVKSSLGDLLIHIPQSAVTKLLIVKRSHIPGTSRKLFFVITVYRFSLVPRQGWGRVASHAGLKSENWCYSCSGIGSLYDIESSFKFAEMETPKPICFLNLLLGVLGAGLIFSLFCLCLFSVVHKYAEEKNVKKHGKQSFQSRMCVSRSLFLVCFIFLTL